MGNSWEGTTVGHYLIGHRLGAGGMGVVFEAVDRDLDRTVAVKFLADPLLDEPLHVRRFLREARAAAAIAHPNICTVHEVGEHEGCPYLVMELLEGSNLAELLRRRLEPEELLRLALDFARGLAEAHDLGLIHRDIKPANLFVTRRGEGKVVDFGLAKRFDQEPQRARSDAESPTLRVEEVLTETGSTLGTLLYMSPEQLLGEAASLQSDVFSFGVVLFEMATGTRPFVGTTPPAIVDAVLNGEPESLTGVDPGLRKELKAILDRALSKDRANRYRSMTEFHTALADLGTSLFGATRASPTRATSSAPDIDRQSAAPASRRGTRLALSAAALLALLTALLWFSRERSGDSVPPASIMGAIDSLAVLPLENLSGDPGQEYFADGMTESLISELSRISSLRVISRQSVMRFKQSSVPPSEIARTLTVDAIIEGSVAREGDTARVTVTLVDGSTNSQLWAESYIRDLESILRLQSDVASDIVDQIELVLTPEERRRLDSALAVDPAAHEAYLKGRFAWNERTEAAVRRSVDWFDEAVRHDPNYALAYVGLADAWLLLGEYGWEESDRALARVELNSEHAQRLSPDLGEPHASLGLALHLLAWDWGAARSELELAVDLSPGYATAHQWYAEHLNAMGSHAEAEREIQRAQEIDPLSRIIGTMSGWFRLCAGEPEEAIHRLEQVLAVDPDFFQARQFLGHAQAAAGDFDQALSTLEDLVRNHPDSSAATGALGNIYARSGHRDQARSILETKEDVLTTYNIAMVEAGLGNNERACDALEASLEQRYGSMASLRVAPWFDSLRNAPCFAEILRRMDLEDRQTP